MKEAVPYLMFDGNCAQAMKFYQKCFKAELQLMPFSEIPSDAAPPNMMADVKNRIMHGRLTKGTLQLMASDTMPGMAGKSGNTFTRGDGFSISISCESKAEVDELVSSLGAGGKVTMQPTETFWGAYFAMLEDQFGVDWMFNFELKQKK